MKKNILVLILFTVFASMLNAQDVAPYPYKNAMKVSPFEFASSKFEVAYERYFNNRNHSLLIMPAVILKEDDPESEKGVALMLQYRFALTHLKKGVNKTLGMYNICFYTGPYLNGLLYEEKYQHGYYDNQTNNYINKIYEKEVQSAEGGILLGMQFDITTRILLDFYVGGGIRYSDVEDSYDDEINKEEFYDSSYGVFDEEYTGVKPKLGLQLGFSF